MAGTPSAPGDEAEAVGEGATAAAASAREAKALAARVHELSRPRGAGGDHSCRSERDFTDFARAAEGWRKDREVLMSLRNLFLLYFMTPACNFHGSGNDFMMYFVTPEHAISISGRIGSPFCCVA